MDSGRVARSLSPGDGIHDLATGRFDAAGGGSGDEVELGVAGMQLSGGHLCERLAKNAAAFHDLKGTDHQSSAHVAVGLHGGVEFHFVVGGVGSVMAKILGHAGGSRHRANDATGDGFLMCEDANARAA